VQRPHRAVGETKEDQVKIARTTYGVGAIVGMIVVAIALAAPIQASSSKPAGMSKAEYRALMLRGEALNKKYHLGRWAVSPASATVSTAGGFSWSVFGIGAAAMLGVVLLAGGAIVGGRRGRRVPRTRISS
jgi:hypothetical protein